MCSGGIRVVCAHVCDGGTTQDARNRTLAVHERVNSRFLVLPGGLSIVTQITGHKYFSPLEPCVNLNIKVSKILYEWI